MADIKSGEDLAQTGPENNELFSLTMDKIEDRWLQYDTIQSEVYDALPTDRQEEATALMEPTDDVRSSIVVLRNFEKKKRGREWLQTFPTAAEADGREEQPSGPLAIASQAEKVQQQDATIRNQQQALVEQQRQAADLRIKTLEDSAAFRKKLQWFSRIRRLNTQIYCDARGNGWLTIARLPKTQGNLKWMS